MLTAPLTGHCDVINAAFAGATAKTAGDGAHVAVLDCEDQPVLCNSWSASPGYLYIFELFPPPAKTDIYTKRVNLTTSTPESIAAIYEDKARATFHHLDGYFHPLDGVMAEYGLAVPFGYFIWFFNVIPSWALMLAVSFFSNSFM